jgi:putative transposase
LPVRRSVFGFDGVFVDALERWVAYRQLFKEVWGDDRLAEIRTYVQQQRALGTPRFQREIEAMIGRCASVRAAHRPRRNKDAFGASSDAL